MTPVQPLMDTAEELLTPGEVARLFRVDPKTVTRWEKDGRLTSLRTLGGHRRYPKGQITDVLNAEPAGGEVVRALEKVHALALETGATAEAGHIADLIGTLHGNG
ncbi:hypothetical protein GCM10009551_050360 [Nocardiopsis tropica]